MSSPEASTNGLKQLQLAISSASPQKHPLQAILMESFSSYKNPQEHSPIISFALPPPLPNPESFDHRVFDLQKEKNII
jgi:hypothetical protein